MIVCLHMPTGRSLSSTDSASSQEGRLLRGSNVKTSRVLSKRHLRPSRPPWPCIMISRHVSAEQQPGEQYISVSWSFTRRHSCGVLPPASRRGTPEMAQTGAPARTASRMPVLVAMGSFGRAPHTTTGKKKKKKYRTEGSAYS